MKLTESAKETLNGNASSLKRSRAVRYAVCLDNRDYLTAFDVFKVYRVLPDTEGAEHGYLRVVDESGEDYLYSAKRFLLLDLSSTQRRSLGKSFASRLEV